ncbi:MAG: class B sortase, partial [Eubacterium sp.]
EYELYAVCKVFSDDGWYSFTEQTSEETFDELISHIQNKSLYKSDEKAKYGDRFLTLSTCEYSQENSRLIIIVKSK